MGSADSPDSPELSKEPIHEPHEEPKMIPVTKGFDKKERHREPASQKALHFFPSDPSQLPPHPTGARMGWGKGGGRAKELDRRRISCALLNPTRQVSLEECGSEALTLFYDHSFNLNWTKRLPS